MMIIRELLKTSGGRRLIFLGLTAGWRLATGPTARQATHALSRAERRRKSRRGHARVSTMARRLSDRVRA